MNLIGQKAKNAVINKIDSKTKNKVLQKYISLIENNQFKIYADADEYYSTSATRKYIITLNLDSHSEPGSVSFEYGTMDGTDQVSPSLE